MSTVTRNDELAQAVQPLALAAYLRAAGWHEVRRIADGAGALWQLSMSHGRKQLLLPLDPTFDDYQTRMYEALEKLAMVEQRSLVALVADLSTAQADIVRIRASRSDLVDGSIPLEEGTQLLQHVQDLVLAAACAAVVPRQYYQTRKPRQATEYLRRGVRLGQTERGSFVLTLIAQLPPALSPFEHGQLFTDPEDPYERRVTLMLAKGVSAARRAAEEAVLGGILAPFTTAVQEGVSANLCDALAGMADNNAETVLDIEFTWSRSWTLPTQVPRHVTFSRDTLPVIKEASRLFRERSILEEYELYGLVTRLERLEPVGEGRVTITTILENPPRQVSSTLPRQDYQSAIQAHGDGVPVLCRGDLDKEGRSFVLRNPHGFRLEPLGEGSPWQSSDEP